MPEHHNNDSISGETLRNENSSEAGFSLVELLVSMSIIGVLSGLSMTLFSVYQASAYNSLAITQLRNLVAGEEAYSSNFESYLACDDADCAAQLQGVPPPLGVRIQVAANDEAFSLAVCHAKGSLEYLWNSESTSITTRPIEVGDCHPAAEPLT